MSREESSPELPRDADLKGLLAAGLRPARLETKSALSSDLQALFLVEEKSFFTPQPCLGRGDPVDLPVEKSYLTSQPLLDRLGPI